MMTFIMLKINSNLISYVFFVLFLDYEKEIDEGASYCSTVPPKRKTKGQKVGCLEKKGRLYILFCLIYIYYI